MDVGMRSGHAHEHVCVCVVSCVGGWGGVGWGGDESEAALK